MVHIGPDLRFLQPFVVMYKVLHIPVEVLILLESLVLVREMMVPQVLVEMGLTVILLSDQGFRHCVLE